MQSAKGGFHGAYSDAEVRPVMASNPSPSRKTHHYGLGEPVRSWGFPP
ncbi:hypothetical protein BJP36_38845 [Moorena producens JHB]|uniref:Uncharacterized protein n=1 Tax=Moorena producens (strain JHB) TaxID=1454205 RepID=A0A9Q9SUT1_MOOP1|nr:hypothetical protein [Moorena producens]WAN70029.1 hypothetical protein BJP36_38845 [Moorena producens JHB]